MRADQKLRLQRQGRITEIKDLLVQAWKRDKALFEKKFIAIKCLEWGAAERTVKEYVNLLVNSGFCRRENGMIFIKRSLKGGTKK